jgi:hypothetical protein
MATCFSTLNPKPMAASRKFKPNGKLPLAIGCRQMGMPSSTPDRGSEQKEKPPQIYRSVSHKKTIRYTPSLWDSLKTWRHAFILSKQALLSRSDYWEALNT